MNWNQVIPEIGPKLYRYFRGTENPECASDLTQETLIRLVKKCNDGSFSTKQGTLLAYSYGIARLVRLEAWKAKLPDEPVGDSLILDSVYIDPRNAAEQTNNEERVNRLRSAIAELNEIQKEIILLHIDNDLTLEDIAKMVGIPVNTVKSHIHRAKDILKKQITKGTDQS